MNRSKETDDPNTKGKPPMYSTQLTDFRDYDVDNLILQLPERRADFHRIRIMTHHLDGTRGDLILSTPRLLTFGLQEQYDPETQRTIGYQLPLVMWGKNGPSDDEKKFVSTIDKITESCKSFLLANKDELDRPTLDGADLIRLNPLYYKIEKGEIMRDHAPLLYTKLNIFRHDDTLQIRTLFTDEQTKAPLDPLTLANRRCIIQGAIRIESIIVGSKGRPKFQVKLFEARVKFLDSGFKSLLDPGKVYPKNIKTIKTVQDDEDQAKKPAAVSNEA